MSQINNLFSKVSNLNKGFVGINHKKWEYPSHRNAYH